MRAFQAWAEQWAREALRVAKPGAHLVAFGGTRTYHRLTCAIEDAGWEIRDSLMWLYGSGFPKSKNLDGAWQGWGTALKPAYEPIILARKPLVGTVTANVERYGTGALNIDGCRVGFQSDTDKSRAKPQGATTSRKASGDGGLAAGYRDTPRGEFVAEQSALGRWPANVVLDETAGAMLDAQAGPCGAASPVKGTEPSAVTDGVYAARARVPGAFHADSGGPSRFFYCAKASPSERNSGVEGKNTHPTVKPVALMRYLVKLVTPPGGLVLDPFCGSGTTGVACGAEGAGFVGIEKELDFVEIARKRIGGIA